MKRISQTITGRVRSGRAAAASSRRATPPARPSAHETTAKRLEVPFREREAECDRDRRLEDHRAGDVAQRQAVLALADPEDAVDLLGQLRCERREDQREHEWLDAQSSATLIISSTKRCAPPTIAPRLTTNWTIASHSGGSAPGGGRSRGGRSSRSPGPRRRRAASRGRRRRRRRRSRSRPGRAAASGRIEAGRRAPSAKKMRKKTRSRSRVSMSAFSFSPVLPPALPDVRGDADDRHREGREQERGADDRPDRDVLGALGAADDRDDRDQRLGHGRADGCEQASHRALAELQLVPDPLDRVREEQGARRG